MEEFIAAANDSSGNATDAATIFSCHMSGRLDRTVVTNETIWRLSENLAEARFAIAGIELVLCLIAFLWNLFIILAMFSRRHMLKEPTNIYLLSLSMSHFMLTVTILPITLNAMLTNGYNYGSSDYARCCVCNFSGTMLMMLSSVALHTLAALSVDRFIILLSPLKYRRYVNWWKALIVVLLIWFVSFWIGIPPVFGLGQYRFNQVLANCHPVWTGSDFNYVRFVLFESLIPIVLLIVTNVWTVKIVSVFMKKRLQRRTIIRRYEGQHSIDEEELQNRRKQWLLVRTFTTLFVVYIISYTPTFIVAITSNFISLQSLAWPVELVVFGWLCYFINPVLHPIIEAFFIKELRGLLVDIKNRVCKRLSLICSPCSCRLKQTPTEFHPPQRIEQNGTCATPTTELDNHSSSLASLRTEESSDTCRQIDWIIVQGMTYRLYEMSDPMKGTLV